MHCGLKLSLESQIVILELRWNSFLHPNISLQEEKHKLMVKEKLLGRDKLFHGQQRDAEKVTPPPLKRIVF